MEKKFTRRGALKAGVSLVVIGTGGAALMGCGEDGISCTDVTGLTPAEITMRQSQEYVDATPDAAKNCLNCNFWESGTATNACGTCQVIKGPIHPEGYCKLWAEKVAS